MIQRNWQLVFGAAATALPAAALRFGLWHAPLLVETAVYGVAIVGAAFMLAWSTEAAERDIPRTLALAGLALIAVLPEYAVDLLFAWKAGEDPSYAAFATANMTGANRLLIGVGWTMVFAIFAFKSGKRILQLAAIHRTEVGILAIATMYSFVIPLRGGITLFDTAFLVSLFAVYVYMASRGEVEEESSLVGPAETIANLSQTRRRLTVLAMFAWAGGSILLAAEPFAEGLIETGIEFGIDEFQLVQWVAPFASEFPEFLVAGLLAARMRADAGLGALVSSKVNQWTLLIGTLPLAYAISSGTLDPLPTDTRQSEEILLTAAQSLLAVVLLINLRMSAWEAIALATLFFAQFFSPQDIIPHRVFSYTYVALAGVLLVRQIAEMRRTARVEPAEPVGAIETSRPPPS